MGGVAPGAFVVEKSGMGTHEQCLGATDEWYTPPSVFDAMGVTFDLDPCHPGPDSAATITHASRVFTVRGLEQDWRGAFVWMNPPFGGRNGIVPWLAKFMSHGNGVALTPDRTSAPWWQDYAVKADAILFTRGKLKFIGADGQPGRSPAQGTTLMASGCKGVAALKNAQVAGLGSLWTP